MQASRISIKWIKQNPLLFSFILSLAFHGILLLIGGTLLGIAAFRNPDLLAKIAQSPDQIIQLTAQELQPTPLASEPPDINRPKQDDPMLYVDVDPSKAVTEPPDKAKFYAAQSTLASNPDARINSDLPNIEGKQTQVTRAFDAPRTKPTPVPLMPSQLAQAKVEPQPQSKAKNESKTPPDKQKAVDELHPLTKANSKDPKQANAAKENQDPGDLDRKTTPEIKPQPALAEKLAPLPVARPQTITEAKMRQSNDPRAPGEKVKMDGGVNNISSPSLGAKGTKLGEYDARMVDAIRTKWYALMEGRVIQKGHVTIEFRIYSNGSVRYVKTTEKDVDELSAYLCQSAIVTPAPYEKWPEEIRTIIGQDYRDVKFTFFYN